MNASAQDIGFAKDCSSRNWTEVKSGDLSKRASLRLLWLFVTTYIVVFVAVTFNLYDRYGMNAYDLGIFDQAVWLISRSQNPFVTIRGVHILGDHFSALLYLLAPLYWIWPSPKVLLCAQTVALAFGAIPVYRIAVIHTKSHLTGLLFAVAYLLYPAMQWSNIYEFHPDTFITPLLLAAIYLLHERRWRAYFIVLAIASLTKETAGVTIAALGCYVFFKHRPAGIATIAFGASVLVLSLLAVRYFNGGVPSPYTWLYRKYTTPIGGVSGVFSLLGNLFNDVTSVSSQKYILNLLMPLMFLPLAAPEVAAMALPALAANLLSSRENMRAIETHYVSAIVPFVVYAAIVGYVRLRNLVPERLGSLVLANLVVWSFAGILIGPFARNQQGYNLIDSDHAQSNNLLLRHIPVGASVSAQMSLAPHVSHRDRAYLFPNPFVTTHWGGSTLALQQLESSKAILLPSQLLAKQIAETNVEFVAVSPSATEYPLSHDEYARVVQALFQSPAYGLVDINERAALFRRGADRKRGLTLLTDRTGVKIRNTSDTCNAYEAWIANQSQPP